MSRKSKPQPETKPVNIAMEVNLLREYKRISVSEGVPLYHLMNAALGSYLKWIWKAELEELEKITSGEIHPDLLEAYQQEILATQKIIEDFRRRKISESMQATHRKNQLAKRKSYKRGPYTKHPKINRCQETDGA